MRDLGDGVLERQVVERFDLAAVVADDVVVVMLVATRRLVPEDAVADVDALYELGRGQLV